MKSNKIIAISGQPVTGKGTTVKALIEKLKEQGYSEESIHVITTGHEFRNYFNAISEFIKSYQGSEQMEGFAEDPYLKKLFENKEYREALINTILKLRQNNANIDELTIEEANNLKEFSGLRKIVDTIIDTDVAEKGKEINSTEKPEEIWIVDSRLAFHNIPESFSIRLTATPEVSAQRLFNDNSRGEEDNNYTTVEQALEAREKRRIGEQKRYIKRYGVDLEDEDNYDLIIDTSYSTIEDISDTILTCLDCYTNKKPFAKTWASPKTFLPLQSELTTLRRGESRSGLEEMEEEIRKNGYSPDSSIEIIEANGIRYLINGHHRNFGQARNNKTLVPYEVIATDDERMPEEYRMTPIETAKDRAATLRSGYLYGHEWLIGETFSYNEIYPGIYERLKKPDEIGEGR